mmetsp:Transcript_23687/g.56078  ORF Transcript_23687/g.56078 Transcript_23687/m.56078 type:complete len:203 (+) Transcript_23687:554-1162(+)
MQAARQSRPTKAVAIAMSTNSQNRPGRVPPDLFVAFAIVRESFRKFWKPVMHPPTHPQLHFLSVVRCGYTLMKMKNWANSSPMRRMKTWKSGSRYDPITSSTLASLWFVWSPNQATSTSPRTMREHASFWLVPGCSPTARPEKRTTHTSVRPLKGARMDGFAYRMARTQQRGFRKLIPTMPEMYSAHETLVVPSLSVIDPIV